jgi:hypothetical protein
VSRPLRFEERELKTYSEPVVVENLREGSVYFALNFLDKELLLPTMEPVVFVGKNLEPGDEERYYFQDAESYRSGIRYATAVPEEDEVTFYSGAAPIHIFEYERALDCLLACSLRRREPSGS